MKIRELLKVFMTKTLNLNCTRFVKSYFTKLYAVYFTRWQLSTIIMLPFMLLFEYLEIPLTLNLILGQCIGSLIFFKIDHFIFKYLG